MHILYNTLTPCPSNIYNMAKIVIAGRSDCPYFARVELLGDRLAKNLKKFKLHKLMIQPDKWDEWLHTTCAERGWEFHSSPIIWRELVDRGGKGVLIGGANEFQEYVKAYYDVESEMTSYEMRMVAAENKKTKDELDEEEKYFKSLSNPVNVCITNAASPVCYHLLHSISTGKVLGPKVELVIHLLVNSEEDVEQVTGTAMETEDLALSLLRDVKVFTEAEEAFEDCQIIIFLDEIHREEDMTMRKWYIQYMTLFTFYGEIIDKKALRNCKVLVCGNGPINFNATILARSAQKIARQNVVAVASVVENQAKSVIGEKLNVNPAGVVNLLVWGNINAKRHLDVSKCQVHGYDGAITGPSWYSVNAIEMLHDNKWLSSEFPALVSARHLKVSRIMGRSTSLSTANSISTLLKLWFRGSPHGQIFSLAVYSEGWYGVPEGMFFSFPVTMDPKGYWHVVQDVFLTPETKLNIKSSIEDLQYELGIIREDNQPSKGKISIY
ncbi:malate dehydrogenase 1B [Biomphalaria pfeifferi]|uniref:Malate dehydrogenase, cytoplasmic n=1 Tax=Biomphalaria pfeifferi TaxID=112525 RepID=A0AAD8FKF1_BIOPF|nr:malate dehydrogenase 1B [Biomphalaria pfeifferi]